MVTESADEIVEFGLGNNAVSISANSQAGCGIVQAEKSTEAAMAINPCDMESTQRRSVIAAQMFFCSASATDSYIVKSYYDFIVGGKYRQTVICGVYQYPGLQFSGPARRGISRNQQNEKNME